MNDCEKCIHYEKEATDDPCFKCLSGYFGLPGFCPKPKIVKKDRAEARKSIKKKCEYLPSDTPLPWSS